MERDQRSDRKRSSLMMVLMLGFCGLGVAARGDDSKAVPEEILQALEQRSDSLQTFRGYGTRVQWQGPGYDGRVVDRAATTYLALDRPASRWLYERVTHHPDGSEPGGSAMHDAHAYSGGTWALADIDPRTVRRQLWQTAEEHACYGPRNFQREAMGTFSPRPLADAKWVKLRVNKVAVDDEPCLRLRRVLELPPDTTYVDYLWVLPAKNFALCRIDIVVFEGPRPVDHRIHEYADFQEHDRDLWVPHSARYSGFVINDAGKRTWKGRSEHEMLRYHVNKWMPALLLDGMEFTDFVTYLPYTPRVYDTREEQAPDIMDETPEMEFEATCRAEVLEVVIPDLLERLAAGPGSPADWGLGDLDKLEQMP